MFWSSLNMGLLGVTAMLFLLTANVYVTNAQQNACSKLEVADIIFLIDGSRSIYGPDFNKMKTFIETVMSKTEIGESRVQIGVIQFSTQTRLEFQLDQYTNRTELLNAINDIEQLNEETLTGHALNFTLKYFESSKGGRPGVRQYLIVITDGEAQDEVHGPAKAIRDKGINIFAIGIFGANNSQLVDIAGSQDKVYNVQNFDALKELDKLISFEVCQNEACSKLEVADIIFLIDGSRSIYGPDFNKMKTFIETVMSKTEIGESRVQIGVIQFSTQTRLEFQLNQYTNRTELLNAINDIEQLNEETLTGRALNFTIKYFDSSKGGRPGERQYLIVITDGEAQDEVHGPAKAIRDKGINIFAIGIFGANNSQLVDIAGSQDKVYNVQNFDALKELDKLISFEVPSPFEACSKLEVADIIFLIDGSRSIYGPDFNKMKTFIETVMSKTEIGESRVQIGVIQFSTQTRLEFQLNQYTNRTELLNAINDIEQLNEETLTGRALNFTIKYFDSSKGGRPGERQYLIVITDGEAQDEVHGPAKAIRDKGINIFAIGIFGANNSQLVDIAGSQDKVYNVQNFDALKELDKLISFEVPSPFEACSKLEVADIIFLIDGSRSIYGPDFNKMKTFIETVMSKTEIGESRVQIGVIQFSTQTRLEFQLNQYTNRTELLNAINDIEQLNEETLTGRALNFTIKYFDSSKGGRPGERQYLIVITDGEAQDEVHGPAKAIRDKGINIFAIGIFGANNSQLVDIAGSQDKVYNVQNFDALKELDKLISFEVPSPFEGPSRIDAEVHDMDEGESSQVLYFSDGASSHHIQQCTSADTGTSVGPVRQIVGLSPGHSTITSGHEQTLVVGAAVETSHQGAHSSQALLSWKQMMNPGGHRPHKEAWGLPLPRFLPPKPTYPMVPADPRWQKSGLLLAGQVVIPAKFGQETASECRVEKAKKEFQVIVERPVHVETLAFNDHSCSQRRGECPAYPTELAFALDMSADVTPLIFERMKGIVIHLLQDINIAESNCPIDARVAVLTYNDEAKPFIRFSDFKKKQLLLNEIVALEHERSTRRRNIGIGMQFVARNTFKRVRNGVLVKKIAVFITNGGSKDTNTIATAASQFSASGIIPVIISFKDIPEVERAFATAAIEALGSIPQKAILSAYNILVNLDIAFVVDDLQQMETVQHFLNSMLNGFLSSTEPKASDLHPRVALMQHTPSYTPRYGKDPFNLEFGILDYTTKTLKKRHIQDLFSQLEGSSGIGSTIEWSLKNFFIIPTDQQTYRVIFTIFSGETSIDEKKLQEAKCKGFTIFALVLEEFVSFPFDQHLVYLDRALEVEMEYAQKFTLAFLKNLATGINNYPPPALRRECRGIKSQNTKETETFPEVKTENAGEAQQAYSDCCDDRGRFLRGPAGL
ncbi:collagen alpha-6(VI) chain-like [Heptranchias perlo]|uniref:collagen alpha-6(VI) chain-like n=1 Tax=Heptranchias perlo TaxID=212740 RepID=UPI0035596F34